MENQGNGAEYYMFLNANTVKPETVVNHTFVQQPTGSSTSPPVNTTNGLLNVNQRCTYMDETENAKVSTYIFPTYVTDKFQRSDRMIL